MKPVALCCRAESVWLPSNALVGNRVLGAMTEY